MENTPPSLGFVMIEKDDRVGLTCWQELETWARHRVPAWSYSHHMADQMRLNEIDRLKFLAANLVKALCFTEQILLDHATYGHPPDVPQFSTIPETIRRRITSSPNVP